MTVPEPGVEQAQRTGGISQTEACPVDTADFTPRRRALLHRVALTAPEGEHKEQCNTTTQEGPQMKADSM